MTLQPEPHSYRTGEGRRLRGYQDRDDRNGLASQGNLGARGLAGLARIGGNQRDRPCYRGAASEIVGLVPFGAASRPSALKGMKCPGLAGRRQV